jgi:hypothetical protein
MDVEMALWRLASFVTMATLSSTMDAMARAG